MRDETLLLMKKEAEYKKKETESFNGIVDRIYELEKDPKVKEYSELIKSINGIPRHISLSLKDIYELAFRQHAGEILPEESNGIYVFMGVYKYDKSTNFYYKFSGTPDSSSYKKYQDIELGNVILVELDKADDFEANNFVVYGNNVDEVNLYRDVQWDFIQEAIDNNQESALKLLHKKYFKEN